MLLQAKYKLAILLVLMLLGNVSQAAGDSTLLAMFNQAEQQYYVPVPLLQAIAFVETRWSNNRGANEGDTPPSYGIMGLRDDNWFGHSLLNAAALTNTDRELLKQDAALNIIGAAAVLHQIHTSIHLATYSLEDWEPVIEKYSGIPQPHIAKLYAHDVYDVLLRGYQSERISIAPQPISDTFVAQLQAYFENHGGGNPPALQGYSGAVWAPAATGNFAVANRPTSNVIDKIIVHDTEGSFASSVSWFQNPAAGVSSHYMVRSVDGYTVQLVDEKDFAYHCGNFAYNQTSIGIEMEGYATDPSYYSVAAMTALKNICVYDCNQWGIAKTRVAIMGHNNVPDASNPNQWGGASNHSDPGGFFDWDTFIQQVSGVTPTYTTLKITGTASLTVRTIPGSNGPTLTTIAPNQEFVSYYQDPVSGWYLVFLAGGNSLHYDGWISNAFVTPDPCATQIKVGGAWPTPLNIRSGPGTGNAVIDQCTDNQRFITTGTSVGWYDFYLPASSNASNGWSSGSYLTITPGTPAPIVPVITGSNTFCAGQSTMLSVSNSAGCTGCTYTWSNSMTGTSINVSNAGSYSVSVTNACGQAGPSNIIAVNAININASLTANHDTICAGENILLTATANASNYQWNGAGVQQINHATTTANTNATGNQLYIVIASMNGCSDTASKQIYVRATVIPTIAISDNAQTLLCEGTPVSFSAISTNGGASPAYQWYKNGVIDGTGASYQTNATNGLQVYGTVLSNAVCAATSPVLSDTITLTTTPRITPGVTITASTQQVCAGDSVILIAMPINGGTPSYIWYINGAGQSGNNFLKILVTGNTSVYCTMASSLPCTNTQIVNSDTLTIATTAQVTPTIAIAATPSSTVCEGSNISFSSTITNGGNAPAYQWRVNGTIAGNAASFAPTSLHDGDSVYCILTSSSACANNPVVTSNIIVAVIHPLPIANAGRDTSLCAGDSVLLNGMGGISCQWSPSSGLSDVHSCAPVAKPINDVQYTLTVIDSNGCGDSAQVNITITHPIAPAALFVIDTVRSTRCIKCFNNLSDPTNDGYLWDFGDSSAASTTPSPCHAYTTAGEYIVALKTLEKCGTSIDTSAPYQSGVTVQSCFIGIGQVADDLSLEVAPNPNSGRFVIALNTASVNAYDVRIFDVVGQIIHQQKMQSNTSQEIDLSQVAKGVYLVQVNIGGQLLNKKIVVR